MINVKDTERLFEIRTIDGVVKVILYNYLIVNIIIVI